MTLKNIDIVKIEKAIAGLSKNKRSLLMLFMGLFSAAAFAPIYFMPAYMIAMPLFLMTIMATRGFKQTFMAGYLFGFGHFFAGLYWIGNSFAVEADVPDWGGPIMVALLAVYLSIFPALVGLVTRYLHDKFGNRGNIFHDVLNFSVLWAVSEWLRGVLFTGFPWNLTGYLWGFSDTMLQNVSIWGIYGLGLFTIIFCFVPFLMMTRQNRWWALAGALVMVFGLFYYGNARLPEQIEYVDDVNLRVVQANIKQQDKWPYENWAKNLITHMDLSEGEERKTSGKDIIIWPETAVIYSLSEEPMRRDLISSVLDEGDMVLTGFPRRQRDPDQTRIYNSLMAIDKAGDIGGIYDKSHLVPFGEYIPSFIEAIMIPLGLNQLFTGGQGFSSGEGIKTLNLDGLPPVGILICYEVIFPGQVTENGNRPDWLLNITNDAWYGESTGPYQHLLQTRVRAIEEGLPLVRSASTGVSAVIDPYGRIVDQVELNKRGVINRALPQKISNETLYSILKQWTFTCISVILFIVNIVLVARNARVNR
ncbi:apolipoprotein N-acyltransferase [Pseudemcibacter aquimaris]|uniref:apolipoprotein N-acyltransferase n=1 Tax=Pseudemcibacter aquimaris TaxID=2857064 RepID=UPI00201251D4|nr:apolipoprotein N-acyltransferase [Pseudemcibacter aquimaris]MCC3862347.1 apolipoprotein N-acyltransferase [Pseudemcibacter aquimaris]WDU59222.1 apolipoprotein N-acyltransferase [Pseudemcibacter aquimaris]